MTTPLHMLKDTQVRMDASTLEYLRRPAAAPPGRSPGENLQVLSCVLGKRADGSEFMDLRLALAAPADPVVEISERWLA